MQRTAPRQAAAIPFHKAFDPAPILTGKGNYVKVAAKDKAYVKSDCWVQKTRWAFNVAMPATAVQKQLTPQAPLNAMVLKGVSNSLDHHHHKSDIAKSNFAEYERSTKFALTRDFFAKKAPLPDHPLHPKTADPFDALAFHERWSLDHKARTVNDMARGPEKIQNYVLAKKGSLSAGEIKK